MSDSAPRAPARKTRVTGAIFLCLFSAFMLTGSRERPWGDAHHTYEVAHNIVTHHKVDIAYHWPPNSIRGRNGKIYSISGLVQSVINVPGELLLQLITYLKPGSRGFAWPLTNHIPFAICGALLCLVFFHLCRDHGASIATASLCTLFCAFGTMVWVYARYPYSDIIQATLFLAFFRQVFLVEKERSAQAALFLGLWAGLLINTKLSYFINIAGAGLYLIWVLAPQPRRMFKLMGWASITFGIMVGCCMGYNYARWGNPLLSGYEKGLVNIAGESVLVGLWGTFLSPGKSIFLYNPPLIIAALALPAFAYKHRRTTVAAALMIVPSILFYSNLHYWPGGWCWGPRYQLYAVPVLLLPVVLAFSWTMRSSWRRIQAAVLGGVLAWGVAVQLLGNAFYWDHYIRIAKEARDHWLGRPNRAGAYRPERGRGHCDDCFEDMYPLNWLPAFQPIEGHYWLLKHVVVEDNWKQAEEDAPWHRYTTLTLNIASSYDRARIDWWVLLWTVDFPDYFWAGLVLLVLLVLAVGLSAASWVRRVRRIRGPPGAA